MSLALRNITSNAAAELGQRVSAASRGTKRRREQENIETTSRIYDSQLPAMPAPGGPTSFVGLISTTAAEAAEARPLRRIKTFTEVAHQHSNLAPTDLLPLSQTDWLPPVLHPRPAPKPTQPDTRSAAAGGGPLTALTNNPFGPLAPSSEPPMDWSLQRSLRFVSAEPFTAWQQARAAPRADVLEAERAFATCSSEAALSLPQRLLAASMSWQFPQNPQPPLGPVRDRAALPASLIQRRKDWQEALCSLYDALRAGDCATFYVASPQLPQGKGHKPYSLIFGAAGVGGRSRLHAVLTRSTPGLRSKLEQQGVEFEAPFIAPAPSGKAGAANRGREAAVGADTSRSMLVFEGSLRVHALFDYLLNEGFKGLSNSEDACDVPILLAPSQFAHAAVKRFVMAAATVAAPAARADANRGLGATRKVHQLEVAGGNVPGWVTQRLLRVLSSAQGSAGLTLAADPLPVSTALNWRPGTVSGEEDAARQLGVSGGCAWEEESRRWCSPTAGLDMAGVKEVTFQNGSFKVNKTTGTVAARVQ